MKLTQEELELVQNLNTDFTKLKIALGNLELQKQSLLSEVDGLKQKFIDNEMDLINKYGADSVINIQTGEVTAKQ
jgi:hypothetical protein